MTKATNCHNCEKPVLLSKTQNNLNISKIRDYDSSSHYLVCNRCMNKTNLYSKTKCKKLFLFNDSDFIGIKHLYIGNPYNNHQYYFYNDIETIITKKYGDLDSLKKQLDSKESRIKNSQQKRINRINKRRVKLMKVLKDNKLEFNNSGDSFMYINYGGLSVDDIITNETTKMSKQAHNRQVLAAELFNRGIHFDETLIPIYNFIYDVGVTYNLPNIVDKMDHKKKIVLSFD